MWATPRTQVSGFLAFPFYLEKKNEESQPFLWCHVWPQVLCYTLSTQISMILEAGYYPHLTDKEAGNLSGSMQ